MFNNFWATPLQPKPHVLAEQSMSAAILTLGLTALGAGVNKMINGLSLFQGIGSIGTSFIATNGISYLLEREMEEKGKYVTLVKIAKYVVPLLAALAVNHLLFGFSMYSASIITFSQLTLTYLHRSEDSKLYRNYSLTPQIDPSKRYGRL